MAKLSDEKISEIKRVYKEIRTYSGTAKIVGCSPATVKKYCQVTIEVSEPAIKLEFSEDILPIEQITWVSSDKISELGRLSKEEIKEIEELWKEI